MGAYAAYAGPTGCAVWRAAPLVWGGSPAGPPGMDGRTKIAFKQPYFTACYRIFPYVSSFFLAFRSLREKPEPRCRPGPRHLEKKEKEKKKKEN